MTITHVSPYISGTHLNHSQFGSGLNSWCYGALRTSEYAIRREAANRIIECYYHKHLTLNLEGLQLTSIPPEIGYLQSLKTLLLQNNQIRDLPREIGQLYSLEALFLAGNQLFLLPPEIGDLQSLQVFDLNGNGLLSLHREIGQLVRLKQFFLRSNLLNNLPPEIGQLQNLQELYMGKNWLNELPSEIGQLRHLKILELNNNHLRSLPAEVFALGSDCQIHLERCPILKSELDKMRTIVDADHYIGPRIHYTLEKLRMNNTQSLDQLLNTVYELCGKELSNLDTLIQEPLLKPWLAKLSSISEFRNIGDRKKKLLALKITEYLELADKNSAFRELFLNIIEDSDTTCGDRMALSIVHLGVAKQLAALDIDSTITLAETLLHLAWPVDQLTTIAREKAKTLLDADEIEIYLGYLIHLKDPLALSLDVKDMLFFGCSTLSESDLNDAYMKIEYTFQNVEEQCNYLAKHELWRKALERGYPKIYEAAKNGDDPIGALVELTKCIRHL